MLVDLNDVLKPAQAGHYAVGLFNCISAEQAEGVFRAAEKLNSPLVIGTAEALLSNIRMEVLCGILRHRAQLSPVPVVLHYDHSRSFEKCMQAMRLGFTSVMYDCSSLTYEENVLYTSEMVRMAHAVGATVEGELGGVYDIDVGSDGVIPKELLTDPRTVEDYCNRTGVDALAVSVGNIHGVYHQAPKLDYDKIREIRSRVGVPLVLHGGSGLGSEHIGPAIEAGISKVNTFTEINQAQGDGARRAIAAWKYTASDMIPYEIDAVQEVAEAKIKLFGCAGKA